jgi:PAS domain S-box-containing protein
MSCFERSLRRLSVFFFLSIITAAAIFTVLRGPAHAQSRGPMLGPPTRIEAHHVSPFIVDSWTAEQGAPEESINAVVQTRDGYLWLGSFSGLVRFDGVAFRRFTPGNTPGVTSTRIHSLHEDRHGTLWVGTVQDGVFMLRDGIFAAPPWNAQLPDPQVWTITETRDGALWFGTNNGIARLDERGEIRTYTARDGIPLAEVNAITEARDGTIWIGLWPRGVVRLRGDRIQPFRPVGIGEDALVSAIHEDEAGIMWVATATGFFRIVGERAELVRLGDRVEQPSVRSITPHPRGGLWLSTTGGLWHLNGAEHTFYGVANGLAEDDIQTARYDREGNLWVAPRSAGLQRLKSRLATTYLPQTTRRLTFMPIVGDGAGGVWAGSVCEGLWHFRDGVFEQYSGNQNLDFYCIWSLHRDPDGTLWIGGSRLGLLRVADGRMTAMPQAGDGVTAIVRDRNGALWIGTDDALRRLVAEGTFESHVPPVPGHILSIVERGAGGLWLGTTAGLYAFEHGAFTRWSTENGLSHDIVRAVLEDSDGTVWVGTEGGGLNRLKDGRITRYRTTDGLFDEEVSHILDDGRGALWMTGSKGISRVTRADLTAFAEGRSSRISSVLYDTSDGMFSSAMSGGGQPAGWHAPDGRLWFPSASGLVSIDPDAPRSTVAPPVAVTSLVVDRHAQEPGSDVTLSPGVQNLEIHYTGLSFVAPHKVQFRYRLDGYDTAWVEAGARRIAYYTRLPPGRYRFEVQARSDAGVWSTDSAALAVRQVPYFYQTGWFAALSGVTVLLLGIAGYRLRLRQLLRRTRELETAVGARTEEVVTQRNELAGVHRELLVAHGQLTRAHDDVLAVLNQTRLGVIIVDHAGAVEFLNLTAQHALGCTADEAAGQRWQEMLSLSEGDRARLDMVMMRPLAERTRLPVRVDRGDDHRYWMEIDIQDDPRDASRRIIYLHDVTELYDLQRLLEGSAQFQGLVGDTAAMRVVYRQIRDVAEVDSTVILEGETGTGKELVARAIHDRSDRRSRAFVAINCAGLTESILTSQLFGHRRGAFTGAVADHIGLLESATGGTLLLDEIGDIPPVVQANLLRVLQEREILRVGETRPRKIDVRVLAATHRDLQAEVAAGRFREDLYYRLRVLRVLVPPLRERKDDIPMLVAWFLSQARASYQARVADVSRAAMDLLLAHNWPGNVRELKGVIDSVAVSATGSVIEVSDLPVEFLKRTPAAPEPALDPRDNEHVRQALARTRGNRAAAARLLGISRPTLYRRLRELGVDTSEAS